MFESLPEKVYCSKCNIHTNHKVIHKENIESETPNDFYWDEYYFIAQCAGCDEINFVKIYTDEDMDRYSTSPTNYYRLTTYPPQPPLDTSRHDILYDKRVFTNVPDAIEKVYTEVCDAFNGKLYYLSTMGLRMLIESICKDLDIKQGTLLTDDFLEPKLDENGKEIVSKSLHGKIFGLYEKRHITIPQLQVLIQIKNIGNQAAHEIKRPSKTSIKDMIKIIEDLLHMHYDLKDVLPKQVKQKK